MVVVYVVQSIGSIASSNNRGIGQEVSAVDPILKVKLEENVLLKKVFPALQKQNSITRCSDLLNVTFLMSFNRENYYGIVRNHVWENHLFKFTISGKPVMEKQPGRQLTTELNQVKAR